VELVEEGEDVAFDVGRGRAGELRGDLVRDGGDRALAVEAAGDGRGDGVQREAALGVEEHVAAGAPIMDEASLRGELGPVVARERHVR
jgi:hypothetical protein